MRVNKRSEEVLPPELLREIFHYDKETGLFTWVKPTANCVKAGNLAGTRRLQYHFIHVNGHPYMAARAAWAYMTGAWPDRCVDHINRNGHDDRWLNLRLATNSQNGANRIIGRKKSGLPRGVYRAPDCRTKPFAATIRVNGKTVHLGMFATPDEAGAAHAAASKRFYGEFSASA